MDARAPAASARATKKRCPPQNHTPEGTMDEAGYNAATIEGAGRGSNPYARRPGMYIGGTDEKALHHLFAEVIDNAMDEAVAGHASFIDVTLDAEGFS